jgi:hypothetical protein
MPQRDRYASGTPNWVDAGMPAHWNSYVSVDDIEATTANAAIKMTAP